MFILGNIMSSKVIQNLPVKANNFIADKKNVEEQ